MAKNWISKLKKGTFSAKAKRAGMSTAAYAKKVLRPNSKASTKTKRQAVAAQTLAKLRKRIKRHGAK